MKCNACGQVESTSHFFISCKKYTDLRNELMYTINCSVTIDVKLVLNGSDTLSADQNIDIFITSYRTCYMSNLKKNNNTDSGITKQKDIK
jgi:hypothetical protein